MIKLHESSHDTDIHSLSYVHLLKHLQSVGTGLNFTEADYVYLIDPWWNPAIENQVVDRSYRMDKECNCCTADLSRHDRRKSWISSTTEKQARSRSGKSRHVEVE
ncbi:helicase-related protein [Sphingobacterium lumbrici]|uniref:helicase-related protein n=1 Tax=Sphingobacterium lumbrici TaxID=2559600 RepID=UPI0015E3CF91|nr:C-terminal helicase domain-containing protein [Sphingobacterium lumbrici]